MAKVRTVFRPSEEIEVSEHEAGQLRLQGLLYEGNATSDEGAQRAQEKADADAADATKKGSN